MEYPSIGVIMEYEKKDIDKSPEVKKVKKGIYKVKGGYAFMDEKNNTECTFEKEESAKIAYERKYGKE